MCVVYVGRFTDQSSWMRRSTKEPTNLSGRESPALRSGMSNLHSNYLEHCCIFELDSNPRLDEKAEAYPTSTTSEIGKLASVEIVPQVNS